MNNNKITSSFLIEDDCKSDKNLSIYNKPVSSLKDTYITDIIINRQIEFIVYMVGYGSNTNTNVRSPGLSVFIIAIGKALSVYNTLLSRLVDRLGSAEITLENYHQNLDILRNMGDVRVKLYTTLNYLLKENLN